MTVGVSCLWDYVIKVGLSLSKKNQLRQWKPFKNDQKCFLFHSENSICSQDI